MIYMLRLHTILKTYEPSVKIYDRVMESFTRVLYTKLVHFDEWWQPDLSDFYFIFYFIKYPIYYTNVLYHNLVHSVIWFLIMSFILIFIDIFLMLTSIWLHFILVTLTFINFLHILFLSLLQFDQYVFSVLA